MAPTCKILVLIAVLAASYAHGQTDTTGPSETSPTGSIGSLSPNDENSLGFHPQIGVGLIRNTITPNIALTLHYYLDNKYKFQLGFMTSFFFERDSTRKFNSYPNGFIHGEWFWKNKDGKNMHKFNNAGWEGLGIAYLLIEKGAYFNGATFKFYYLKPAGKRVSISVELIFTDDFKTFFPGVTVNF